jgi:hypothetical protein
MAFKCTKSTTDARKKKEYETQAEGLHSLKDSTYNLRPLATTAEDILHVYSSHDGGSSSSEATNQLTGMIWKPRRHLTEVPGDAKL